jgi:hypothetical protein
MPHEEFDCRFGIKGRDGMEKRGWFDASSFYDALNLPAWHGPA